jgi:hypothetical protein
LRFFPSHREGFFFQCKIFLSHFPLYQSLSF